MCENDITFAPRLTDRAITVAANLARHLSEVQDDDLADYIGDAVAMIRRLVKELEASRLTRKRLEDVAALLFRMPDGTCFTTLETVVNGCLFVLDVPAAIDLLCEALLPKE